MANQTTSNTKHALQTLLEDVGGDYELQSYSGRAMYGERCLGVTGDMTRILAAIVEGCLDSDFTPNEKSAVRQAVRAMRSDSMGRDTVVYFPGVAYIEAHRFCEYEDCDEAPTVNSALCAAHLSESRANGEKS